ncbi:MAG: hypothetical protein A2275_02030 [Bacteroidetes bacterium RIFOXYA12_FULL_35_11]|nr:MAG: hypothetical protein A2X01_04145 [Bacteroidetes bacterium GWF2_35_48]OFY74568.1 MAG: hypothetical protein A2275_02030 [Bacteroidetes bacterium RIFOXYA12_FULL_35_11]OFY94882.1 MAG: hypothetical protein A2309_06720 [Bacteroidetes bacterium RIFOXYB2_FULL_35_7]
MKKIFDDWFNNLSEVQQKELLDHIFNNKIKSLNEGYFSGPIPNLIKGIFTGPIGLSGDVCPTCKRPL